MRLHSAAPMGERVPPEYGPMLQDTFGTDTVRDRFGRVTSLCPRGSVS